MIIQDALDVVQGTDEWKIAKLGHISASNIDAVMAKGRAGESETRRKYKLKLIAERLSGEIQESYSNQAMLHGVETEPLARTTYEIKTQNFVDLTGFWKHPTIQWLGVSPDGLVGDDGLVEIKCPNTSTHISYIENGCPSEYYKQIQCQLWVTGRKWCDFISFDDRIKVAHRKIYIHRVERDEPLISEMEAEVVKFLNEVEDKIKELENGITK
jgi:putative phage-type endonuclease